MPPRREQRQHSISLSFDQCILRSRTQCVRLNFPLPYLMCTGDNTSCAQVTGLTTMNGCCAEAQVSHHVV